MSSAPRVAEATPRFEPPPSNCSLCPRLVDFREANRRAHPEFYNGAVDAFGRLDARFLVVGLAPGLRGANCTGRPFTGDAAGDLLYPTLTEFGFADGDYAARVDDGLMLVDCRITNAVRCVPPDNKPIGAEIRTCRDFLGREIAALTNLRAILALGRVAHEAVLAVFAARRADYPFKHGAAHGLSDTVTLFDSYHCSRYNTNTGRLTPDMFDAVFRQVRDHLLARAA